MFAVFMIAGAHPQALQPEPRHQHQHDKKVMDARGGIAMGFDQSKIAHRFIDGENGGAIEIRAKSATDAETIAKIQSHLKEIEKAFAEGDFSKPFFIHDEKVPGTEEMAASKTALEYRTEMLIDGGRVLIVAKNATAKEAVHTFLRYQREAHK